MSNEQSCKIYSNGPGCLSSVLDMDFILTWTEALVFKTGVFLSFEMVILAGIILSKTKK